MTFLLDADTFITPKNSYYPFDLVPGFWDWVEQGHMQGVLHSVEAVKRELIQGGDDLATWAKAHPTVFLAPSGAASAALGELATWVHARKPAYTQAARAEFLSGRGDLYLIAQAKALGATVVTFEKSAPSGLKRVKIPDACAAVDVPCIDLFACMRDSRTPPVLLD